MLRLRQYSFYLLIFFIWALSVAAKYKYNGLVYGLDFGLYHPDGSLYAVRALDWAGYSEDSAVKEVAAFYNSNAYKFNTLSGNDLLYNVHPKWAEYYPRILYPLVSVPFVLLFGIPGMLVIPALSLLVILLVIGRFGRKLNNQKIALILITLLSGSPTILRWMMANTTDALLVGLFALSSILLLDTNSKNKVWYVGMAILITLTGLTRFSLLFWLGNAIVYLLQKERAKALYLTAAALIISIPTFLSNSGNSFLPVIGDRSYLERAVSLPYYFLKISFYEFAQLFVLDRILLVVLVLAVIFSLLTLKSFNSRILLMNLFMGLLTGAINGTLGVNFRYQLPIITFVAFQVLLINHPLKGSLYKKN